eukprot:2010226-Amphidinium_carterae.1
MQYAGSASHIESGAPWTDALKWAWHQCKRAVRRGIGPEARAAPFPTLRYVEQSLRKDGPTYPQRPVVLLTWWFLRQIEGQKLTTADVTVTTDT